MGAPVAELIRKVGISEETFYRWKAKYTGMEVDPVRQLKKLRDENAWLKQLVAELTLDKTMLRFRRVGSSAEPRMRLLGSGPQSARSPPVSGSPLRTSSAPP